MKKRDLRRQSEREKKDKASQGKSGSRSSVPTNSFQMVNIFNHLQQTYGNKHVQGLIQPKLKISQPNDKYEQEADRIAEQVVRSSNHCDIQENVEPENSQIPLKHTTSTLSPQTTHIPDSVKAVITSGNGRPLVSSTRESMESNLDRCDFSEVRVHNDVHAEESAQALGARAYTFGKDIVFARGEYSPGNTRGKILLAHELVHVLQQKNQVPVLRLQKSEAVTRAEFYPSPSLLGKPFTTEKVFPRGDFPQSNKYFDQDVAQAILQSNLLSRYNINPEYKRDKSTMRRIVHEWHDFATEIVVANDRALIKGFCSAVANRIFEKMPGLTVFQLSVLSASAELIETLLIPKNFEPFFGTIFEVVVHAVNHALGESELADRIAKFNSTIVGAKEFQNWLYANLYNLSTVLVHYMLWIERASPDDFPDFCIPFAPEEMREEKVAFKVGEILEKHMGRGESQ